MEIKTSTKRYEVFVGALDGEYREGTNGVWIDLFEGKESAMSKLNEVFGDDLEEGYEMKEYEIMDVSFQLTVCKFDLETYLDLAKIVREEYKHIPFQVALYQAEDYYVPFRPNVDYDWFCEALDRYSGDYESKNDFAYAYIEEYYSDTHDFILFHIDMESVCSDLLRSGYNCCEFENRFYFFLND